MFFLFRSSKKQLGWEAKTKFKDLVKIMVDSDLELIKKKKCILVEYKNYMERISLMKSTFYKEEDTKHKLFDFIQSSRILSMKTECEKYEQNFSEKQKRTYSVYVSNVRCATLLLIQALMNMGKLKLGDKIFVSNLTWPTNVMPLIQLGLVPVFLDVELETLNVSSTILKDAYKKHPDVKGFFITNALGFCSDIDVIKDFCEEKGILFIEDNCESLGSKYKGEMLGNYGLASTFSFFVGHHLSTIEGGMICTDDEELYENLKMSRSHGWTRNNSETFKQKMREEHNVNDFYDICLLYTSDAADDLLCVDLGGRRILKKKKPNTT